MLVSGFWLPPPSPNPESEHDCSFSGFCPPSARRRRRRHHPPNPHDCSLSGSATLCLPPPSPKRAFVLVSGFLLPPPPCQPRKRARLLVFGVAHPLPAATTTTIPEMSTNARFWVLTALHHLPTPPSACPCHHYPQNEHECLFWGSPPATTSQPQTHLILEHKKCVSMGAFFVSGT